MATVAVLQASPTPYPGVRVDFRGESFSDHGVLVNKDGHTPNRPALGPNSFAPSFNENAKGKNLVVEVAQAPAPAVDGTIQTTVANFRFPSSVQPQ